MFIEFLFTIKPEHKFHEHAGSRRDWKFLNGDDIRLGKQVLFHKETELNIIYTNNVQSLSDSSPFDQKIVNYIFLIEIS